jgi:hypothetical protein
MKIIISAFFICFCFILNSQVFVIDDINHIYPFIDDKTIVLFDIDDVIICPQSCSSSNDDNNSKKRSEFLLNINFPMQYQFVDKSFKDLFNKIKKKALFVGGLTARRNREHALWDFFNKEGIFFNLPFSRSRLLKKGIIFCRFRDKGKTLFKVLKLSNENIVFVDDKMENCLSVSNACKTRNIKCFSFQYKKSNTSFNINKSKLQSPSLIPTGVIIPDDESKKLAVY